MKIWAASVIEAKQESGAETTNATGSYSRLLLFAPGVVFACIVLLLNRSLFTTPIFEYTDFAANGLQVERAKHFRELLGNYSRWGFHHPGPAFFYYFALGEKVLHDWLHVVPAEMNAHIVCMIVLNTIFLFATINVIASRSGSDLFPPVAIALAIFFIYVVNRSIPGSALLSIWMPHVLLFCFLFFITACASVASGKPKHLVWLALSGLMLIHGHVAQPLFVGTLGGLALCTLWWRKGRVMGWRQFLAANRMPITISILLLLLFAVPIVSDVILHTHNNVRAILRHEAIHPGIQQSFGGSLKYEFSFLSFIPNPEVILESPSAHLIARGWHKPIVAAYWCLAGAMIVLSFIAYFRRPPKPTRFFFQYGAVEILLLSVLFYCWTLKMTGRLFNFNGYFFFSIQLFVLLLMAAFILDAFEVEIPQTAALCLCIVLPMSMLTVRRSFVNTWRGDEETNKLIASLPVDSGRIFHLTFDQKDWMTVAGVASRMKLEHEAFCVDDLWAFPFGHDNVCRQFAGLDNLILTHSPATCDAPCKILMNDGHFELRSEPYPSLKMPFTIKPDDLTSLNKGFNEFLGTQGPVWSTGHATIYFRLASNFTDAATVRIQVYGSANSDRPVKFWLNGHLLGSMTAGHASGEFFASRTLFVPGENHLSIEVDHPLEEPGDPQNDPRVLGFSFLQVQFDGIEH